MATYSGSDKRLQYLFNAGSSIAEDYNSTSGTYVVGDYCLYAGKLYKCIEEINDPEDFDSEKWEEVKVVDEISGGGGGGTIVIANPSGEATDDLTKIQINRTIYNVGDSSLSFNNLYPTDLISHEIGENLFIRHYIGVVASASETTVEANFIDSGKQPLNIYGRIVKSDKSVHYLQGGYENGTLYAAAKIGNNGHDLILATGSDFYGGTYEIWVVYRESAEVSIALKYNNATSGSTSYTIEEDGLYLIIASRSYSGSASITLPSGRTPILSRDVEQGNRGMKWRLVELLGGDIVTMSATASSWVSFSKSIYKLNNTGFDSSSTVYNNATSNDGTAQLAPPNTSDKCLLIGIAMGRTSSNRRNDTVKTGKIIDAEYEGAIGVNTLVALYYGTGATLPTIKMYGYDGGGAFESCLVE